MRTLVIFCSLALLVACAKNQGNEKKVSTFSSDDSHNNGQNCMTCHVSNGGGEGWFTAAGSVYKQDLTSPNPGCTVNLYSEPNGGGSIKATLQVDKVGNFYTTENIEWGSGLYPAIKNGVGTEKFMSSKITTGACQSCHGTTTDKIWVD